MFLLNLLYFVRFKSGIWEKLGCESHFAGAPLELPKVHHFSLSCRYSRQSHSTFYFEFFFFIKSVPLLPYIVIMILIINVSLNLQFAKVSLKWFASKVKKCFHVVSISSEILPVLRHINVIFFYAFSCFTGCPSKLWRQRSWPRSTTTLWIFKREQVCVLPHLI